MAIVLAALGGVYFYTRPKPSKSPRLIGAPIATNSQIEEPPTLLFDITPANDPTVPGYELYDCTYRARGKTAKFRLQFRQEGPLTGDLPTARASGKFLAMPGSDNSALLEDLMKALEATHLPAQSARTAELPFDAVVLGEKQSRGASGGWAASPAGDWKAVKIFLPPGGDGGEMFLGLNRVAGKGEFSIKDADYGDYLIAQLATVL